MEGALHGFEHIWVSTLPGPEGDLGFKPLCLWLREAFPPDSPVGPKLGLPSAMRLLLS